MRVKFFLFFLMALLLTGQAIAQPKIAFGPNKELYRYWTEKGQIKYTTSFDYGNSFTSPQNLSPLKSEAKLSNLKLDSNANFYFTYILSGEVFLQSQNNHNWDPQLTISITNDALHIPEVSLDNQGKIHTLFVTNESYLGLNRLYYSPIPSMEPKVLFESQDTISSPQLFCFPQAMVAMWKTDYSNRSENYLSVSINSGESFSSPQKLFFEETPASFIFEEGKPVFIFVNATDPFSLIKKTAALSPLPAPEIKKLKTQGTLEVVCQVYTPDTLLYRFEISSAKDFTAEKTQSYNYINKTASPEAHFVLPAKMEEGEYFLRAVAFDGLTASPFTKTLSFKIDFTPPVITLLYPTKESTAQKTIVLQGEVNESSTLQVNGSYCSLEALSFSSLLNLHSGKNSIEIRASDEAGNLSFLTKSIICSSEAPEIILQSPKETDWFKPGSTLFLSGQVYDAQNDVEDETEAAISIIGIPLTENDNLLYYKDTQKISGFIPLPKDLVEGKFPGKILLTDQNGNTGEAVFEIKVDKSPPFLSSQVVFSNLANAFTLPLEDSGAGVSSYESLVKINGITFESRSSSLFLADGSYEVEVTPKDLAGNVGKAEKFTLVIDTKSYGLSLSSSVESRATASSSLISSCGNAPNPFSPSRDGQMSFVYTLPSSANLVFYIFDLSGTMVWKKELANSTSGTLTWNGINHFGVTADRGVYSYLMKASAGGKTESRRGKIIVF